jgi:hypothetical protein
MSGYISNVPLSNQSLGQTQPTINNNFTVLNTNMGADHVDFTFAAPPGGNGGRHNTVTMIQQSGDPAAVSSAPILYSKLSNAVDEIFMRRASGDGGQVVQMTTAKVVPSVNVAQAIAGGGTTSGGSSFLPGGVVIQWGTLSGVGNGGVVPFAGTFPTACFGVTLTVQDPGASTKILNVRSTSTTNFTVNLSSGTIAGFYFAIGN